jgi:hypothetical protein
LTRLAAIFIFLTFIVPPAIPQAKRSGTPGCRRIADDLIGKTGKFGVRKLSGCIPQFSLLPGKSKIHLDQSL